MTISLHNTGKRYNREWIFRHCTYRFEQGKKYAITGSNGSGKSTLLQVIAGATLHNEGSIEYRDAGYRTAAQEPSRTIEETEHYTYLAIAAPYLELIEEMTATEMLEFHGKFKRFIPSVSIAGILQVVGLEKAAHKQIRYFSSGMKQRLKLAQAFFCKTPVLLLDEPLTNLDKQGAELYLQLTAEYGKNRLVIISSNDPAEYVNCDEIISIADFKN